MKKKKKSHTFYAKFLSQGFLATILFVRILMQDQTISFMQFSIPSTKVRRSNGRVIWFLWVCGLPNCYRINHRVRILHCEHKDLATKRGEIMYFEKFYINHTDKWNCPKKRYWKDPLTWICGAESRSRWVECTSCAEGTAGLYVGLRSKAVAMPQPRDIQRRTAKYLKITANLLRNVALCQLTIQQTHLH